MQPNTKQPSSKSKYGEVKRRAAVKKNLGGNQPHPQRPNQGPPQQGGQQPQPQNNQQPQVNQRPPFDGDEAYASRREKLTNLKEGANVAENLKGVGTLLNKSVEKGGVDRGLLNKGMGGFTKVYDGLKEVQSIEAKGKFTGDAMKKLVKTAQEWQKDDKKELLKDPTRANDPVAVRKRQAVEAILLHDEAEQKLLALQSATDWDTYDQMAREAETAVRNCQAASLTIKTPPDRRKGGDSDTYKILNEDGSIAFFFKPQAGEAVAEGWEAVKGGGAPREVLVSEFGDQMKKLGFDFNIPKITEASLTSSDFAVGENSKDTGQAGVVIDAVKGEDGKSVLDKLKSLPPGKIKAIKESISKDDVHNMVILDFMTLNMDRHQGNIMFDMDLDDNNNVKRPTKIVPIDAGNMLPPETVFDSVNSEGFAASEGMDAPIRGDTEVPAMGMHMLMQLPQAKQPFDQTMIDKIRNLDPAAVAGGMKQSDAKRQGAMAGKIGDDTFQLVEESVHFLKLVVGQNPPPIVNVIGKLYAMPEGFKAFKAARRQLVGNLGPNDQLDESTLVNLVAVATAKANFAAQAEQLAADQREQYAALGGDPALYVYGWDATELSTINIADKIDHLTKKTLNPAKVAERDNLIQKHNITKNELPNDYDTAPFLTQVAMVSAIAGEKGGKQKVEDAGGDAAMQQILNQISGARSTAVPDKPLNAMTWKEKATLLGIWEAFQGMGGYAKYQEAVDSGLHPFKPSLQDQKGSLQDYTNNDVKNLTAANTAGGKASFNALKNAVAAYGIESTNLKKEYEELSSKLRKEYAVNYMEIKDLPAFKNYQQLVAQGRLPAAQKYADFLKNVKAYEG